MIFPWFRDATHSSGKTRRSPCCWLAIRCYNAHRTSRAKLEALLIAKRIDTFEISFSCQSTCRSVHFLILVSAHIKREIYMHICTMQGARACSCLLLCLFIKRADSSFQEQYKKPVTSVCCWHVHCEQCWLHTLVSLQSLYNDKMFLLLVDSPSGSSSRWYYQPGERREINFPETSKGPVIRDRSFPNCFLAIKSKWSSKVSSRNKSPCRCCRERRSSVRSVTW